MKNTAPFATRLVIWLSTSIFYAYQLTLRVLPAIMMDDIMYQFSMSTMQYALFSGTYYLAYAFAQIPVGLALDKFQPRLVLSICIAACLTGILFFAYGSSVYVAYCGRLLIGMGSVAGILGAVKAINDCFPKQYPSVLGLTVLIGTTGAIYAGKPIIFLKQSFAYQTTLEILAGCGAFVMLIILIFYKSKNASGSAKENWLLSVKKALENKQLWQIGIFGGLLIGPLEGFADVWAIKFFMSTYDLSQEQAAHAMALIFIGLGVGGPIIGMIAQKTKNLYKLVSACGFLMLICFSLLLFSNQLNYPAIACLSFLTGVFSSYQVVVFTLAGRDVALGLYGLSTSIANTLMMSFGFIFHIIIGKVLEKSSAQVNISEIPIFSTTDYQMAFAIIIMGTILGSIGFFIMGKNSFRKNN